MTDHDAIKAAGIIPGILSDGDPAFLPGVELSCRDGEGKYHILGYGYDPAAEPINTVVSDGHRRRIDKVKYRLDALRKEYGFTFPDKELEKLFSLYNPGKPHIGNLMVKLGSDLRQRRGADPRRGDGRAPQAADGLRPQGA